MTDIVASPACYHNSRENGMAAAETTIGGKSHPATVD